MHNEYIIILYTVEPHYPAECWLIFTVFFTLVNKLISMHVFGRGSCQVCLITVPVGMVNGTNQVYLPYRDFIRNS